MDDNTTVFYRRCFSTDDGQRVLSNMLLEAGFFEELKTSEEQAVENFMKVVLTKCGSYGVNNLPEYVRNLMNMKMEQ